MEKFVLGRIVATPGALELEEKLDRFGQNLAHYLERHEQGDWGDLSESDKEGNEASLKEGNRLMSSYITPCGKLWIITEYDRSVTTLLLPEEY